MEKMLSNLEGIQSYDSSVLQYLLPSHFRPQRLFTGIGFLLGGCERCHRELQSACEFLLAHSFFFSNVSIVAGVRSRDLEITHHADDNVKMIEEVF